MTCCMVSLILKPLMLLLKGPPNISFERENEVLNAGDEELLKMYGG